MELCIKVVCNLIIGTHILQVYVSLWIFSVSNDCFECLIVDISLQV